MTVQDLLRHTSGLTYGGRGDGLIHQAYRAAKIGDRSRWYEEPEEVSPGVRWRSDGAGGGID